jgi:ribonuclease I
MLPASDYFKLAISLHKDNLIAVILRNNGITPDATTKRSPADIVNILKMHTKGKEPQLMCDTSKKLLAEVRICFEKSNASDYHDCPKQTNCDINGILYPPGTRKILI